MLPSCLLYHLFENHFQNIKRCVSLNQTSMTGWEWGEKRKKQFWNTISQMFILLAKTVACTIIKSSHDPSQAAVCRVNRRRLSFMLCQGQNESLIWLQKMHIHQRTKQFQSFKPICTASLSLRWFYRSGLATVYWCTDSTGCIIALTPTLTNLTRFPLSGFISEHKASIKHKGWFSWCI